MPPLIPHLKDTASLLATILARRPQDLQRLYERLTVVLYRGSMRARYVSVLKYAACAVLLVNAGSLPLVWHIRVFWPIITTILEYYALCLKLVFASRAERTRALVAWVEDLSPVGMDPFEFVTVHRGWASLDDVDMFGMHLSNSSYAKALDSARVKALVKAFPACGRSGGQMALGATHYHFIREIAALATYEVRLTIGSWDHKWVQIADWLYIVARYVTRPTATATAAAAAASGSSSPQTSPPASPDGVLAHNGTADIAAAIARGVAPGRPPIREPDGALLHCVAVSQICYKHGGITVPPAVVLASEGFTAPYDGLRRSYSRTHPPPNWVQSQAIRVAPLGSMEKFQAFLKSGWRDVPKGERWWEEALGGTIETKRRENLEILESLKVGLERTRTV